MTTKSKLVAKTAVGRSAVNMSSPYINPKLRHVMTYNLGDGPKDVEEPFGVSATVPNMVMSIQELVTRHTRGLPIPDLGTPSYSDQEFPDLRRYDMAEIELMKEHNAQQIEDLTLYHDEILRREAELKNPPPPEPVNSVDPPGSTN